MEIRLTLLELVIVILGLLTSGTLFGIALSNDFSNLNTLVYSIGSLLVSLTLMIRKRFKVSGVK